ncbi:EpsG family protein [Porphyromonas gingivicanis]|nr:EpsG family protein [Porphyromonas gingivicanis]
MFEYILVLSLGIFLASTCLFNCPPKVHRNLLFGLVLCCGFIVGGRDMLGGYDVYNYVNYFDTCPTIMELLSGNSSNRPIFEYEPLYFFLNVLLKSISSNKYFFLFFTAMISYLFLFLAVKNKKYGGIILLLLLAKFFIVSFIYIRQFLSITILWFAFTHYLEREKSYRYILWVVVASLFHYSAIVALCIVPFRKVHLKKIYFVIFLSIGLAIGMLGFLKPVGLFLGELSNSEKVLSYSSSDIVDAHWLYLIEVLGVSLLFLIQYNSLKKKISPLHFNTFIFYLFWTALTLKDPGFLRLQWFFYWGFASTIPLMILNFPIKQVRHLLFSLLCLYAIVFYFRNVTLRDDGAFIPYKAFYQDSY